ncbi:Usp36 [Ecytonucleospora hepatopenaei]|uniref:Usp36 n=1 Tax=Ecytonucleospora hepatopenaei TaxID=646526 RepID=A0A1W0E415_9MICR|nr:Usp36 [Ecytonucleospora hepatopenaei]
MFFRSKTVSQVKGLANVGNTCFFNSVMQCLLSLEKFTNFFEKETFTDKQLISRALQNFILFYKKSTCSYVDPTTFIRDIKHKIRLFDGSQQDAHAYLELLLSLVFTENQGQDKKPSSIEKLFSVEHKHTITCKSCLHKEERKSISAIQWLFIKNSVKESIDSYEGIEDFVDDSAQWKCSDCNKKVSTGIKHKITKCSEYLILHLNRFLDVKNKNTANIYVDEKISVGGNNYRIVGIVSHTGSLNYGHYYSYAARTFETREAYKCNDKTVTKSRFEMSSDGPYILFYEKQRETMCDI